MIDEITTEIESRSLSFIPIMRYMRREGIKGKLRRIGIESCKQQICDYAAVMAMEDFITARVGFWQVGSVAGKGELMLVHGCKRWLTKYRYHAHLDVRKCYPSIKTDVVMGVLRKYIKSADVLYLCQMLFDTYDGCLEIGSYLSLRMAQLLLSFGYHMLEDEHKERRGKRSRLVKAQGWYADDIFLFSDSKHDLKLAVDRFESFMHEKFGLSIKGWKIKESGKQEPCDVLAYTVRPDRVTIKGELYLRIRRAYTDFERHPTLGRARRVTSYWGYIKHSDSNKAMAKNAYQSTFNRARRMVAAADRKAREKGET